ncbi:MAG: hypothetical protein HY532_04985 [Chloroflexi bacterium]|nr:hypothetical protein [Chloroflexota bacterium]
MKPWKTLKLRPLPFFIALGLLLVVSLGAGVVLAMVSSQSPGSIQPPPPGATPPDYFPTPPITPSPYPLPELKSCWKGPCTKGFEIGVVGMKNITLPPDIWIHLSASEVLCDSIITCPPPPLTILTNGRSYITVATGEDAAGRGTPRLYDPDIAPGDKGVFDFLYEGTGIAKGQEKFSDEWPRYRAFLDASN